MSKGPYISRFSGCHFIYRHYGLRKYIIAVLKILIWKRVNVGDLAYESYKKKVKHSVIGDK